MAHMKLIKKDTSLKRSQAGFLTELVSNYRLGLDSLEQDLANKKSEDDIKRIRKQIAKETDLLLAQLNGLDARLESQKEQQGARVQLREQLRPVLRENSFIIRCLDKPQGYPGDFMMMEVGYEDQVNPHLRLGTLDRYFIDKYYSIILRKEKVKARIKNLLSRDRTRESIEILAIGGGPAREWLELGAELGNRNLGKVRLTYLDQDADAMAFAAKRLDNNPLLADVEYRKESLFEFSRSTSWRQKESSYDFVYGIGIADYFFERVLVSIVAQCLRLARKGGEVLMTHKDHNAFPFAPADWLCDWTFVHRSKSDFKKTLSNAVKESGVHASIAIDHEPSGEILFGYLNR